MPKYELLSPAGDMECIKANVKFGADAVYVGGNFMQLRAASAAFDREKMVEAANYLHQNGKKLYVTVNSFAQNDEIEKLKDYAKELHNAGADAAIVSDIGAISVMKEACPELEIHVSTQANCMNYAAANVYYSMGAKRVVLARELSLDEIKKIRDNIPADMELEAFVHGAMCMSYSGRCLISSFMTGRSANRGLCTQPCRWKYYIYEENRPGEYFRLEEENGKSAVLSSHDLKMIEHLDELKNAGVCSFKIEGRMKTAYYTATVTNAYRKALEGETDMAYLNKELDSITHRPYSTGFYFGELKRNCFNDGEYIQNCKFVASVLESKNGMLKLQQRNHFAVGERLEILSPNLKDASFVVEKIYSEKNEELPCAPHPQQTIFVPCPYELSEGDILRRRND